MDTNIKKILIELQEQNADLLELVFSLSNECYTLRKHLNEATLELYNEIYNSKSLQKAKDFLEEKKETLTFRNNFIDIKAMNSAKQFDKRHDYMVATLEQIKNLS